MSVMRLIAAAAICTSVSAPVFADVTLRMTMVEKELDGRITTVTEYRKGLKMRTDSSGAAIASNSTIWDLETGVVVMLWHDGKSAVVFDPKGAQALGRDGGEFTHSIKPTAQSRQIAGSTCTVYEVRSSVRMTERMVEMTEPAGFVLEGSICVVKDGPGQADFARQARVVGAMRAAPDRAVQGQIAEVGVPYATELTISLGANVPGAAVHKIATHTTEVTSVTTAPIPDAMFEIPAGYTVRKQ